MTYKLHGLKLARIVIFHRLDRLLLPRLLAPSTWLLPLSLTYKAKQRLTKTRGERLALALEAMGPVFIKFGQVLSMRQDVFPNDVVKAMARLQDQVESYDGSIARLQIENDFGKRINDIFAEFNEKPLAAASIAQVHAAKLLTGEDVAVKVLRPNIRKAVAGDIKLMYKLAKIMAAVLPNSKRLNLVAVVSELENQLHDELNLRFEAANASAFKSDFPGGKPIKVPKIHWDFVSKNVMVAERIYGVPIVDVADLKNKGVNCQYLAELGLDLFFKQVFENNFFHADLHGGNIFVDVTDLDKPSYICVDFGIMGALSAQDKYYIAENLLAFFNRDYRRVAELHIDSGWVPKTVRVDQFESAIRAVSEPIFALPLAQISFGKVLVSLLVTVRKFDVEIQPQLILLQKTLLNVEALSRMLYPELDLWTTAKPYLENWTKSQLGVRSMISKLQKNMPFWLEKGLELPQLMHNFLQEEAAEKAVVVVTKQPIYNKLFIFLLGVGAACVIGYLFFEVGFRF